MMVHLQESVTAAITTVWTTVAAFIPRLVGALTIFLLGLIVSFLAYKITETLLQRLGFDAFGKKICLESHLAKLNIKRHPSKIIGGLIFWVFFLLFLVSVAETLGLSMISKAILSWAGYLPKIIGATAILMAGLWIANLARGFVLRSADQYSSDYAKILSNLTYGMLVVVIIILALGQLQMETELLRRLIEISLFTLGGALVLMFGFGAKSFTENVIAGIYARETYKPGDYLSIGEMAGELESIGAIAAKIKSKGEILHIPNAVVSNSIVRKKQ